MGIVNTLLLYLQEADWSGWNKETVVERCSYGGFVLIHHACRSICWEHADYEATYEVL